MAAGPVASSPNTDHYEVLRNWALTTARSGPVPPGAAVVLRSGLAHWLLLYSRVPALAEQCPTATQSSPDRAVIATEQTQALVGVLATLVRYLQQEVAT